MAEDEDRSTGGEAGSDAEMSEAEIDCNVMGSFPASDPPSWTLGVSPHKKEHSHFEEDLAPVAEREKEMVKVALFVRLEAKPGKEEEVAEFLRGGLAIVEQEPATVAWFAIRFGPTTFGIFDAFPDEAGRQAHLSGKVAAALMQKAPELLAEPPRIEQPDVLAAKLPQAT